MAGAELVDQLEDASPALGRVVDLHMQHRDALDAEPVAQLVSDAGWTGLIGATFPAIIQHGASNPWLYVPFAILLGALAFLAGNLITDTKNNVGMSCNSRLPRNVSMAF